jgi:hypothetical protein
VSLAVARLPVGVHGGTPASACFGTLPLLVHAGLAGLLAPSQFSSLQVVVASWLAALRAVVRTGIVPVARAVLGLQVPTAFESGGATGAASLRAHLLGNSLRVVRRRGRRLGHDISLLRRLDFNP